MAAIQPAMFNALRRILNERYVNHLPPLLSNGSGNDDKQISRAFSAFVLQSKFGIDAVTAAQQVVDDYNDNGIDAIYYHKNDKTLYLLQSKLRKNKGLKEEAFSMGEAQAFAAGVRLILSNELDRFNDNVKNRLNEIEDALDQCDCIQLMIAYTCDVVASHAKNELDQLIRDEHEDEERLCKNIDYFDAEAVENALRLEQALKSVDAKIKVNYFRKINEPRETVFGLVDVISLVELHKKHDKALYEKNIRYFIGAGRRGVNQAIKDTLMYHPESFLHLNNGITIVCNSLKGCSKSRDNSNTKNFDLSGASVVNGAQTIASAAQFISEHPSADISAANVMVTIIQASEMCDFHKQVTQARNLQNPVELSHFAALDGKQEYLRREIMIFGYEYHYRPHIQVGRRRNRPILPQIDISELAKALACLSDDVRYPAYLKSEPSQFTNFEHDSYKAIFNDEVTGAVAINAVLVFRIIKELLEKADASSSSPERLVYRHCTYALAFILMKRMKKNLISGGVVLTEEQMREVISSPFDELRQKMAEKYSSYEAAHAYFKRVDDASKLIRNVMVYSQNMQRDEGVKTFKDKKNNDPYNQRLVNYLIQKSPQLTLEQGRR
jgi:hypothetical protein